MSALKSLALKTEEQIAAEAYNRALAETQERKWEEGDLVCHPSETVLFRIDRFASGSKGRYVVAEILDPDTKLATGIKRFLLREITDPYLVRQYSVEIAVAEKLKAASMLN